VGIEPSEQGKIKLGLPVDLESVLPERKPVETKVKGVGGAIDPKTKLLFSIDLSEAKAIPGESLKVKIRVGKFEGWVVPRDSVKFDKKGASVFQVDDDHAKKIKASTSSDLAMRSARSTAISTPKGRSCLLAIIRLRTGMLSHRRGRRRGSDRQRTVGRKYQPRVRKGSLQQTRFYAPRADIVEAKSLLQIQLCDDRG
jgi:hypothetical protein